MSGQTKANLGLTPIPSLETRRDVRRAAAVSASILWALGTPAPRANCAIGRMQAGSSADFCGEISWCSHEPEEYTHLLCALLVFEVFFSPILFQLIVRPGSVLFGTP